MMSTLSWRNLSNIGDKIRHQQLPAPTSMWPIFYSKIQLLYAFIMSNFEFKVSLKAFEEWNFWSFKILFDIY